MTLYGNERVWRHPGRNERLRKSRNRSAAAHPNLINVHTAQSFGVLPWTNENGGPFARQTVLSKQLLIMMTGYLVVPGFVPLRPLSLLFPEYRQSGLQCRPLQTLQDLVPVLYS